jgi:hypothetical protein
VGRALRRRPDPLLRGEDPLLAQGCRQRLQRRRPYWQAPARSAQQLIALLTDADRAARRGAAHGLTTADLDRAYRPIKAFRTRYGAKYGFDVDFHHPAVGQAPADSVPLAPLQLPQGGPR